MKQQTKFKETEIGKIPKDWEMKKVGDYIELVYGESLTESKRETGEIPVYGSNGIIGYHNKALVTGQGIIIGRKGSVGEVTLSKKDFWAIDTTYYVKLKGRNDILFWYYLLKTFKLNLMNSHSAVPGLNRNDVYEITNKIPNLSEQKAIAKILSDLDSKIELNQQMNQTFETVGKALFKHWFVDFEFPNEKGKPYKSSGGEMINSELGEIPKGWQIKPVKDFGKVICGKTPSTLDKENFGYDYPFITIPDMHNVIFVVKTERKISEKGAETQKKKELPPLSICVSCIATSGLVSLTTEQSYTNQQINSIICNNKISPYFMYLQMKNKENEIQIGGLGGTATLNLNTGDFERIKLIMPDEEAIKNFNKVTENIFQRILNNSKEIESLSQIRDALLPKLMSGKIRVT